MLGHYGFTDDDCEAKRLSESSFTAEKENKKNSNFPLTADINGKKET